MPPFVPCLYMYLCTRRENEIEAASRNPCQNFALRFLPPFPSPCSRTSPLEEAVEINQTVTL